MLHTNVFDKAKYIKAQREPSPFSFYDPAPLFRKEFELCAEDIGRAQIFVQSPGFAYYFINGRPITEDIFISPISDYRKILWYNTYDVTPLLQEGKNVISVIAGNGFFNESFDSGWHYGNAEWRDAPQFILQLNINGKTVLTSNGSWKTNKELSPIIYNHLRSGEYFDARKDHNEWMYADYDDSLWDNAMEREKAVTGEFRLTECQPVREVETVAPLSLQETAQGILVDFGLNMSGYMEITLKEPRGREIVFRYAEEVDENRYPKHNHMDDPVYYSESPFQINKLIASGSTDTFKPQFSYHGFRYVLIEGLSQMPQPSSIKAHFIHQDIARTATFESGNAVLNYIYEAGIRSTYSNMFWCITDCPTREKLGWTNDAQATAEQALINFDVSPLYKKWFEDVKSGMREDGSLSGIIPSPDWGFQYGPVCDCFLYELPYRVYLYTNDKSMLVDALPYFDKYLSYFDKKRTETDFFLLGDWMGNRNSKIISKPFVCEFYFIKALKITILAYRLANKQPKVWERTLENAIREFQATYLDETGKCTIEEQSALAMVIEAELFRDRKPVEDQLIQTIARDNFKLTAGMVGVQYLYNALTHCGHADIAYKLITESEPGYKTWLENGATTLWETWDGKDRGSHNHHMFSGVIAWFFTSLLGIAPNETAPAFESIKLNPHFIKEVGFVKGSMNTVRGAIQAEWRYENNGFIYKVNIPEGIRASFRGSALSNGTNTFIISEDSARSD